MKKVQVMMMSGIAMCAFCAIVVTAESAETTLVAKWLTGAGNEIPAGVKLGTESSGGVLVEDTGAKAATLCSFILVGTVSSEGKDEVTGVLNFKKKLLVS
jgi:hypothetical protein